MTELENLQDKMHRINSWIEAYPIEMFPEPDLKRAAVVLKAAGMTLDSISASSMRHVLDGIKNIIAEPQIKADPQLCMYIGDCTFPEEQCGPECPGYEELPF